MKFKDHSILMTVKNFLREVRSVNGVKYGITTEFGVVDITRKEAIRMLETCEKEFVYISYCNNNTEVILEYPSDGKEST